MFVTLGYCFNRDGKGTQGQDTTLRKGIGSWWRDAYIYRSRGVPLKIKYQRIISHVLSTVLNGSINWNWTEALARSVRFWESKIMPLTFRPKKFPDEEWVSYRKRTVTTMRTRWQRMGLVSLDDLCSTKICKMGENY